MEYIGCVILGFSEYILYLIYDFGLEESVSVSSTTHSQEQHLSAVSVYLHAMCWGAARGRDFLQRVPLTPFIFLLHLVWIPSGKATVRQGFFTLISSRSLFIDKSSHKFLWPRTSKQIKCYF